MQIQRISLFALVVVAMLGGAAGAQDAPTTAPTLKWGDAAPPIKVVKWLKGTPVERFEPGKTYVIEFWATWCGPCKAAMPHLSELAKKYDGKITFIGVDVWEEGDDPLPAVEKFVEQQGENMAYNVAADKGGRQGFMAMNWLDASQAGGIPATFVIDDGKIVWTGHPDRLGPVLEQITAKTYDFAKALKEKQEQDAVAARVNGFFKSVNEKMKAKDYAGAVKLMDSDVGRDMPDRVQSWIDRTRFEALLHVDEKAAIEHANRMFTKPNGHIMRRFVGRMIATVHDKEGLALSKETFRFGAESFESTPEPPVPANIDREGKAICYAGAGDYTNAVIAMRGAIELAENPYLTPNPELVAKLEKRLEEYKKLAGDTTAEAPRPVRAKPAKVYDENADAKKQIADALASAKKNNRRVLLEWGGNWCVWCLRLNEVMASDKAISRMLATNYELVHVDAGKPDGKNVDLAHSYGATPDKDGYPFLTILDADGKPLLNQESGALELGSIAAGHNPTKVLELLRAHAVNPQAGELTAAEAAEAQQAAGKTHKQAVGQQFELSFTDAISGKKIDVQKGLKGKVVVVDFWATWCGPCVADMPKNKELYAKYKDKGVEFIGVSLDHTEARGGLTQLKDFVAQQGITWPQYYQGNYVLSEFSASWGITSIPTVFIIDADGKLASTKARENLEQLIQELLAKREGKAAAAN